jgi:hypothetical protein
MMPDAEFSRAWMTYALTRIQKLVDGPREEMSEQQLDVYTFAVNALAGGDPVIAVLGRGPGHRLCRVCLAEWSSLMTADHAHECPVEVKRSEASSDR